MNDVEYYYQEWCKEQYKLLEKSSDKDITELLNDISWITDKLK